MVFPSFLDQSRDEARRGKVLSRDFTPEIKVVAPLFKARRILFLITGKQEPHLLGWRFGLAEPGNLRSRNRAKENRLSFGAAQAAGVCRAHHIIAK